MTHWLFPANTKFYDVFGAFQQDETYWPLNAKVAQGDVVYIYLAAPHKQIGYICDVLEIGLTLKSILANIEPLMKGPIDSKKEPKSFMKLRTIESLELTPDNLLGYTHLKANGLNGMLMGPRKLENNPTLLDYIKGVLS
ncbi:MAG: hypothetical protein OQK35_04395 [Alphaproteobacteria bacterium]|nr:hypothetical protein [Rhodospirillales bacterium]MCW9045554.1 hypothetical protein [Alphaproteobacteria bacterium]